MYKYNTEKGGFFPASCINEIPKEVGFFPASNTAHTCCNANYCCQLILGISTF